VSDGEQQLLSGDEQHRNGGGNCDGVGNASGEPDDLVNFCWGNCECDFDGGGDGPE
jgi:hypothetical protein